MKTVLISFCRNIKKFYKASFRNMNRINVNLVAASQLKCNLEVDALPAGEVVAQSQPAALMACSPYHIFSFSIRFIGFQPFALFSRTSSYFSWLPCGSVHVSVLENSENKMIGVRLKLCLWWRFSFVSVFPPPFLPPSPSLSAGLSLGTALCVNCSPGSSSISSSAINPAFRQTG